MRFSPREVVDLVAAWLALGVAFTFFLDRRLAFGLLSGSVAPLQAADTLVVSMLTVGIGFLLHELAHKVVAVRFGQLAEFRADYGMLALAIGAGLAGFLFAAPGAVYHGGRPVTSRQVGLIALAGPATNVLLAGLFVPLLAVGPLVGVGQLGVTINLILAGFNMIPFGPLDGRKVLSWNSLVFALSFVVCAGLALFSLVFVGTGF
ncbi:metalloprotease [Halomarina ordinaria]|uniref:Metalloprotease n=1 Tax=Halomarina ordinaria TaxID=3033939 RepID=A0ABD5UA16_9EURY|nr:metalloprotease [Halomarina sp. PSRA2]